MVAADWNAELVRTQVFFKTDPKKAKYEIEGASQNETCFLLQENVQLTSLFSLCDVARSCKRGVIDSLL